LAALCACSSSSFGTSEPDAGGGDAANDAPSGDGGSHDSGAAGSTTSPLVVSCSAPGNAGATGQPCDFLLSPNVSYPAGASNNNLATFTAPTSAAPHGDADPCTRRDPSSQDNVYMTYTYTNGGFLSTKLAVSSDRGASWTDPTGTSLWSGAGGGTTTDPYTGSGTVSGVGVINSETSNLAFRSVPGGVVAYGLHEIYWQANAGTTDHHTKHLDVVEAFVPAASSPTAIHDALAVTDGAINVGALQSYPGVTACPGSECIAGSPPLNLQNAAGANGTLADCAWFHEPALRWQEADSTLYLAVICQSSMGVGSNRIVVFGTPTDDAALDGGTGSPGSWTWSYQGVLLTAGDAATAAMAYGISEPSTPYFTQGELALDRNGGLLYLASLVHLEGQAEARDAVFALQVGSLASPALTVPPGATPGVAPYAAVVQLKLTINGGDNGMGPGSSTYDPALTAAGILYAGRTFPGLMSGANGFETDLFSFPAVAP
jgi:hypothetical protein